MRRTVALALTSMLLAGGCGDDGGTPSPFGDAQNEGPSASALLENLGDGNLDEGDLDDLMESAQELAEGFADAGAGTVSINDDTIDFTSELCIAAQGDFSIDGPGTTSDGTPAWVSISLTVDSRAERAEFFGEEMLQTLYGDADPIIDSNFSVDYGRTDLFGQAAEGMPSFSASSGAGGVNEVTIELNGQSASGSGSALDYNFVVGDFDTRFDFTFEAACS